MEERYHEAEFNYKTDVTKHFPDNPEHTIDFEQPEVLASASYFIELFIDQRNNQMKSFIILAVLRRSV